MSDYRIAAAQFIPNGSNIEFNLTKHIHLIDKAGKGTDLILFPELSITGYEPGSAHKLAFDLFDSRIRPLQSKSTDMNMIIVAGAPVLLKGSLNIGAFILYPDRDPDLYTKHYLHPGEEKVFDPGRFNPEIYFGEHRASGAICADIANPQHVADASKDQSTIYLASVFVTPVGYEQDCLLLKKYASKHKMDVIMSNFAGASGGIKAAGGSCGWTSDGQLIASLDPQKEGVLMIRKLDGQVEGSSYYL